MKIYTRILLFAVLALMLNSCYEPLEVNTDNISKVEVPIRAAMPLVDGLLEIEYDSIVDFSELGEDLLSFENKKAYIAFDTVIDFYDQLSVFLAATDIDLSGITAYDEIFLLDPDVEPSLYPIAGPTPGGWVDTAVLLSVPDSFETRYGGCALFLDINAGSAIKIDGLNIDKTMEMGLDFGVYRIQIQSGLINLDFDPGKIPIVNDDSLVLYPSVVHEENGTSTLIKNRAAFNILNGYGHLPEGVYMKAVIKIPSIKDTRDSIFHEEIHINSLDTLVVIDLAGYYYYSETGNGDITVDLKNWFMIEDSIEYAIMPISDTLAVSVTVDDLMFEHVVFNYGLDTMLFGEQDVDLDYFDNLPDDLEINGFKLADPELIIKLRSNLGFAARLDVNKFGFETESGFENITNDGRLSIDVKNPSDPEDITIKVETLEDVLLIDSTTSRVGDIDVLSIKSFNMDYAVIINPDDRAGNVGEHNFFYKYDSDVEASMYDVSLSAKVRVPVSFRFDNIKYTSTIFSPIKEMNIDSMITMSENDSINLNVDIHTLNFPFELKTQFYFGKINASGELDHIDSMFNNAATILPLSNAEQLVSASWSLSVDAAKYENLKQADSVTMVVMFAMDDVEYFELKESDFCKIGYKFTVSESSLMFKNE